MCQNRKVDVHQDTGIKVHFFRIELKNICRGKRSIYLVVYSSPLSMKIEHYILPWRPFPNEMMEDFFLQFAFTLLPTPPTPLIFSYISQYSLTHERLCTNKKSFIVN